MCEFHLFIYKHQSLEKPALDFHKAFSQTSGTQPLCLRSEVVMTFLFTPSTGSAFS